MFVRKLVLPLLAFFSGLAGAQQLWSVPQPVAAAYTTTHFGLMPAGRIKHPGHLYVIRISGLLAQPIAYGIVPTQTIVAGALMPSSGFRAAFGKIEARHVRVGDRYYIEDIAIEKQGLLFTLRSQNTVIDVADNDGDYGPTRISLRLLFPLTPQQMASLTSVSVHQLTDRIFAPVPPPI
jgi:hypothetical protein